MAQSKNGRPRIELDNMTFSGWDQLDALIIWANQEYCADKLGINKDTLAEKIKERTGLTFPEYREQKKEAMRVNLRKKQYDIAMQGNVSMLIWLGKNELGQSDKQEINNKATEKLDVTEIKKEAAELLAKLED